MENGTIRVICGPGNGKTASAIGYGIIRAAAKKRVIVVQFLKGVLEENNVEILKRLEPEMKVFRFERSRGLFENLTEEQKKEEIVNLKNGFHFARKVLVTGECDVLILDEVLGLLDQNVVSADEFKKLLESGNGETELVITGRVCPEEIRKCVDYVSYVENIKVDNPGK